MTFGSAFFALGLDTQTWLCSFIAFPELTFWGLFQLTVIAAAHDATHTITPFLV